MIGSNVGFGMKRLTLPADQELTCACRRCTGRTPAVLELRVEVAGERVERLVVVVVGVDGPEVDVHGRSLRRARPPARTNVITFRLLAAMAAAEVCRTRRRDDDREEKPHDPREAAADRRRAARADRGGELSEGDSLGHEPDLVERFGVSRPSLREALRILEAEGLITVVRGVRGGVVVHEPDERMTARTAALVLQARNVPLGRRVRGAGPARADAAARDPRRVRRGASGRRRSSRALIDEEEAAIEDPEAFGVANAALPRAARRAGRQPDAEHRRRDAQRDRGPRRHRGQPGRRRVAVARRSARRGIRSQERLRRAASRPATAPPPRRTGARTWRSSAR